MLFTNSRVIISKFKFYFSYSNLVQTIRIPIPREDPNDPNNAIFRIDLGGEQHLSLAWSLVPVVPLESGHWCQQRCYNDDLY